MEGAGNESTGAGQPQAAGVRPTVFCVVPAALATELHELLRLHYSDEPGIQVIVERRGEDRRLHGERRDVGRAPRPTEDERRRVRSRSGRRIAERRAAQVPTAMLSLPSAAQAYAEQLSFIERLEPSSLQYEDVDTARLIGRIQAGERGLFDELYMRYFDRVYAYVRVTLQDTYEAEDVTQDVFVRVLEALPRYERRSAPFRAWLFRIVRNCAINRIRQRQRLSVEAPADIADRGAGLVPAADSPQWLTDRNLLALIEELPLSQRQVIVLRYMMEFRSTEISQILDRSPAAVRQLHQRAMQFLRRRVDSPATVTKRTEQTRVQRESMVRLPPRAPVARARRMALR
jgi:RNA polymerase sigma-70 factor (ECF subfamily)